MRIVRAPAHTVAGVRVKLEIDVADVSEDIANLDGFEALGPIYAAGRFELIMSRCKNHCPFTRFQMTMNLPASMTWSPSP